MHDALLQLQSDDKSTLQTLSRSNLIEHVTSKHKFMLIDHQSAMREQHGAPH